MSFHVRVGSSGVIRLDRVRIWLRELPYRNKNLTTIHMELNCIFNNFLTFKKRKQLNYFTDKLFKIVFLLNTIKFLFWWLCF